MLLDRDAEIGLIEEAGNGKRAAELMLTGGFNLIFLDVQMPEMDGFAALRRAGAELPGAVIFVTAYDHYAVDAFEVNAAEYLLKPFTPQRFRQALERAKTRIRGGSTGTDARVLAVLDRIAGQPTYLNRIAVRGAGGTSFVDTRDVEWLKASENYVEIARGAGLPSGGGDHGGDRTTPRPGALRPHSPLCNREYRTHPDRAVRISLGVPGDSRRRHSASLGADLQRGDAEVDIQSVLTFTVARFRFVR
jgi:hypothetical protein